MSWQKIIGQERVKNILRSSILQNRIAHSYLFYGDEGIGKDALAIEFAKTLLCKEKQIEACNKCVSCQQMNDLHHLAFQIINSTPSDSSEESGKGKYFDELQEQINLKSKNPYHKIQIAKANFIRIETIRSIRYEAMQHLPNYKFRFYLVTNADEMNIEASNSFLKILEEPNPSTIFLLTTSREDLLLPTIKSRCQHLQCEILSDDQIAHALIEKNNLPLEQAKLISKISRGSFRRAQELLTEDFNSEREDVVNFIRSIVTKNPLELTTQIEKLCEDYERVDIERILNLLQLWLRDSIMVREGVFEEVVNFDQQDSLERFVAKFGNTNLNETISIIDRSLELLKKNVYLPLVLYFTSIELRKIFIYAEKN